MYKDINKILEFDKIKEDLSKYAMSETAKKMCINLSPFTSYDKLVKAQKETQDAFFYLAYSTSPSFDGLTDNKDILERLSKESSLSTKEFLDIKHSLDICDSLIAYKKTKDNASSLDKYFDNLNSLKTINIKISTTVLSENEIASSASSVLQNIRRKKMILNDKVSIVGNKLLEKYKNYLHEPIITNRNGKQCLLVKAEYKNQINGIVQDISNSGLSIFIEPKELVDLSNEIATQESLENIEIEKILFSLSTSLVPYIDILKTNYDNLVILDFIFAKANFAKSHSHTLPILNNNRHIKLIDATHPLIDKNVAVPLNIELNNELSSLIITGPNTGGKTVCLKTIGLIEMMGLSGLFIPAKENSIINFFDNIFADIGDEQSIEMSLSTFSSHMVHIIDIVNKATKDSLCLFDELAVGTDPLEGANLAISIIDFLRKKNAFVIATTHYPELKVYAINNKNISNASFEFDINTLKPTYKLLLGIPGKSNAFLISEKLGLNKDIIDHAKNLMNTDNVRFEDVVANLEYKTKIIEKEKIEIEKYKKEIDFLKQKVEREQKGLNDRASSVIRQAEEKARSILLDAKEVADKTIKDIRKDNSLNDKISSRTNLNKHLKNLNEEMIEKTKGPASPLSAKKIKLGIKVKILSMNAIGTVESLPDKDYNLFIRVGILRVKANLRDLEIVKEDGFTIESDTIKKSSTSSSKIKIEKTMNITTSINLIGKTTDEALSTLDKYLDDCYISRIPKVTVIHGRGTGALKNAIHKYLKKLSFIKDFYSADYTNGGDGATVVEFN